MLWQGFAFKPGAERSWRICRIDRPAGQDSVDMVQILLQDHHIRVLMESRRVAEKEIE
jgi:hypothetical protein